MSLLHMPFRILAGAFFVSSLCSCSSLFHASDAIEAAVIDADTGQPLGDVIVVAHWELVSGSFGGRVPVGQMKIMETITNSSGSFRFPSWQGLVPAKGRVQEEAPTIRIYKNGYQAISLSNSREVRYDQITPLGRSVWNGKRIKLHKTANQEEMIKEFRAFNDTLSRLTFGEGEQCNWHQYPLAIDYVGKVEDSLVRSGIMGVGSFRHLLLIGREHYKNKGCGSVEDFLKKTAK